MPLVLKKLKSAFDPKPLLRKIERDKIRVQMRFGAYARRAQINSIKYKPFGASAPAGKPPFAHRSNVFTRQKKDRKTGAVAQQASSPLRELIYFARDAGRDSVLVGPIQFGRRGAGALERGGTVTTSAGKGKTRTVRIRPHPSAKPAGEAAAKKLPELLKSANK